MEKICKVEGCEDGRRLCRGLCRAHYHQWQRGDTSIIPNPTKTPRQPKVCSFEGCLREGKIIKGYCDAHYRQYLKHGKPMSVEIATPNRPKGTLEERFWASLEQDPEHPKGCWEWTGYRNERGYGTIGVGYRSKLAHRVSYDLHNGTNSPSYMPIHHTCGNNPCVRPDHLQRISPEENTAEMRERYYYQERIAFLEGLLEANGIEY